MDIHETKSENSPENTIDVHEQVTNKDMFFHEPLNIETIKSFFRFTGGSLFYCISAVFIAYGIVNLMGPILSEDKNFINAMPCIITLHVYELALLGVLILIVSRKVVDDAISVIVFIALFLIGTSMALGTIADKNITMSFCIGLIGIFLTFSKFFAMWRFVKIKFAPLSILGLSVIIIYNYLSPIVMARSIANNPSQEPARRALWLLLSVAMMIGAGIVLLEAIRRKSTGEFQEQTKTAFLQKPIMVYIFALILLIVSGIHQYAMAYTFALERSIGDYVPVSLIAALFLIEILRNSGKKFDYIELGISCTPLVVTILAIHQQSVISSGDYGIGLLFYPPVILALSGMAIAALALYHRWYPFLYVTALYGLGVILTIGFSPVNPYDLNTYACVGTLLAGLLVYGAIKRNQYVCVSAIIILCLGLLKWDNLSIFSSTYGLKEPGVLAGVCGIGIMILYLLFGSELNKTIRIIGVFCLTGFIFDYLPEYAHWKYIIVSLAIVFLMVALWFRTKDILFISTLWVPIGLRLYMLAKQIAYWRIIILGFLLLIAGTIVSLVKRPTKNSIKPQEVEKSLDTSP